MFMPSEHKRKLKNKRIKVYVNAVYLWAPITQSVYVSLKTNDVESDLIMIRR